MATYKSIYLTIIVIGLLLIFQPVLAILAPSLAANDELKVCQPFSDPYSKLPGGWRYVDVGSNTFNDACQALGYNYNNNSLEGDLTLVGGYLKTIDRYGNAVVILLLILVLGSIIYKFVRQNNKNWGSLLKKIILTILVAFVIFAFLNFRF